jgi:hypothetical protein
MLQRIQSMFLFIILGISVSDLFVPLAIFEKKNVYELFCLNVIDTGTGQVQEFISFPLLIVMAVIVLITVITIFSYKNRPRQIKFCKLNILMNFVFIVVLFYFADEFEKLSGANAQYTIGAFLPLASVVLLFLTNRSVKKDEELVKSADRLR